MENEIRKIIAEHIRIDSYTGGADVFLDGIEEAARAIAKWLQGGVVFEGRVTARIGGRYVTFDSDVEMWKLLRDGEHVTMTVRRETNNDTE